MRGTTLRFITSGGTSRDPVLLVLDNFSGHDNHCIDPKGQVKVLKLPPNITSVYQPLDQGVLKQDTSAGF